MEHNLKHLEILKEELKTITMKITHTRQKQNRASGQRIKVKSLRQLGTILEDDGNQEKEISDRVSKVGKIYNAMKRIFLAKKITK